MRRVRTIVSRSDGKLQFLPLREIWAVSGALADTFPLDRSTVRGPRWARQLSNWSRLVLVDRAVTDDRRTAVMTLSETPWLPAVVVAIIAALVAPRLPRWARAVLFGAAVAWVVRERRGSRFVAMRRELAHVAPGGVLVGDFVAFEPGAGMRWAVAALDRVGDDIPFIALLPDSGDPRRDAARERLYVRRLGFRRVSQTAAGGQAVTVLVREASA
jgi:hypothetical protein